MPLVLFALAIAFAVMLLFGGTEFDRGLLMLLYAGERPDLALYARWVTELGGAWVLIPVTAAGALWLGLRRRWGALVLLLVLTGTGRLIVELTKDWAARVRPDAHEHLVPVQSLAFPSGHAANATTVWLALAFLVVPAGRARAIAVWAAVFIALAVGASRVMLGVHWPTDVIGGWAFGLFWTLLLLRLSGHRLDEGTPAPARAFPPQRSETMTDRSDRGQDRAETARRTDDSDLIDKMEPAPSHGNRSGHRLGHDIGSQDELEQAVGDGGATRVRDADKRDGANLPRFNQR